MNGALPTANTPLLAVRDLTVTFAGRDGSRFRAAADVGFTLYPDQTLAVVGESGSGKSVTALSILRLIPSPPGRLEGGRVLFARRPRPASTIPPGGLVDLLTLSPADLRDIRGAQIAMIFQEPMTSLNPLMTVGEQIAEAIRTHTGAAAGEARERAIAAMAGVGIADARRRARSYPHEFSGGMRQRVMIAMALACEPSVLLADEPTTALDVTTQAQILNLIDRARRERTMGVILITHDLGVVARRADVLCVMYAGRVVEYGPAPDVLSSPLHPYTRGLLACLPEPGRGRPRLTTVREVVEGDAAAGIDGPSGMLRPWWPGLGAPPGPCAGEPSSMLAAAGPGRWVRVWEPAEAPRAPRSEPDVPFRRSMNPAGVGAA